MEAQPAIRTESGVPGVTVLELVGEHDMTTTQELRASIDRALEGSGGIVVDLSETEFIDSSVVHALHDARRELEATARQLVIQIRTHSVVKRVLELTELTKLAALAEEREQAIALAQRQGPS